VTDAASPSETKGRSIDAMGIMHGPLPFSLRTRHKVREQLEDAYDN
jgi:hypothetical protein